MGVGKSKGVATILCRVDIQIVLMLGVLLVAGPVLAQGDPQSNVNVIGMTPDPADIPDTYYRQQNEPACAVRPGDSACIICAYNDYRGVDFPVGDSWQGVSQSCDAGATWRSRLAPGHPGDLDADLIPAEFAADPRLIAIPGMAIFNFIAGFRDSNVGVLGIQHWLEVTKEDADHWEPGRTTWFADTGTSGRFLDKPDALFLMASPSQQGTIRLTTEMENTELSEHPEPGQAVPGFITRDFPTGTLYVAYAVFTGSNSIKVLVKTSDDLGRTWKNQALKLSEDQNEVSGISLTAVGDKVLAVWRRKGDNNDPDSILYSIISNGGKKATKGEVLADICVFDQPTLTGTEILELVDFKLAAFRTNDFPWAANDGDNLFVFYSDRGRDPVTGSCLENAPPRIVMHYSTDSGQSWNPEGPIQVDPSAPEGSFQFMPTAFGANGKVQIAYYDTRREGALPLEVPFVADFESFGTLVQRTVDVYTTNVTLQPGNGQNPAVLDIPAPVRVSQFSIVVDNQGNQYESEASFANSKLFAAGKAPFLGDYIAMAAREFRQVAGGPNDGKWQSNASFAGGNEDFFAAWTSNRDVFGTIPGISEPSGYTKPANAVAENRPGEDSADEMSEKPMLADNRPIPETGPPRDGAMISEGLDGSDPSAVPAVCTPNVPTPVPNERSRDANIYGSLIKDQVRLYAPTTAKPLSGVVRAFVIALSNSDVVPRTYDLQIVPGGCNAASCKASFRQQPSKPPFGGNVLVETGITVPAKSTLARTIFVAGDQPPVIVEAYEGSTLISTIQLANAPSFLDPENYANSSFTVATSELHNLELQTIDPIFLASLMNDPGSLDAFQLDAEYHPLVQWAVDNGCCDGEDPPTLGSVIEYAVENIGNAGQIVSGIENAALLNAALLNANLLNANLLNAALLNAALLNANLLNANPEDLSVLDPQLVTATSGCCGPTPTIGDIIVYAFDPANGINAALLNAALLNVNLLNANLLNANLLNANLLNANLLNANLLNAALLNLGVEAAALLNQSVDAASLLNSSLLNTDLVNANLLNPTLVDLAIDGGCCGVESYDPLNPPSLADVLIYSVGHPETINAALLNASLLNANLLNANLLNANLLNANLLNANLLNANLVDTGGADDSLLNADLINADFVNANLLNTNVLDDVTGDVTFDDYTYPLTNNGNVTTAIDIDITINAPTNEEGELDIVGAKLMTWTANATPTVVDCIERVQLDTRVQSITGIDGSFEVANIDDPFVGQVSAVVAAGQTVFATLRVTGSRDQLKNVRVNAFTASSQAANCFPDPDNAGSFICDDELTQGDEQIVFQDVVPPIITVPDDITVDATGPGGAVVEYTVTVFDAADANPILECLPESGSFFDIGTTLVTCNASDASGNQADTAMFNVTVLDTTAPVISLNGDATVTLQAGVDGYTEQGATATDDGDPAVTVIVGGDTVDTGIVGTYVVTYNATDSAGNAATQVTRTVIVQDTIAPVITLNGPASVILEVGVDTYTEAGASVTDAGDPTVTVVTGGDVVDTGTVGTYVVTYNATDASGNAALQVTRTVNVQDTIAPVITLNGAATVTLQAGTDTYTELGASVTDAGDPTLTTATVGGDTVNPGVVGTYIVTYGATDASGNVAVQKTRTVNVVDTVAPVIILNGDATITLEADLDTYVELGATVIDAGSPATPVIVGGDTVDTNVIGTYVVTYNATDASGNAAVQVTRTVNVVDTTAPVIDPVEPPTGFDPDSPFPFELAADESTLTLTWPVSVTDADPNLDVSCSIGGEVLPLVGDPVLVGDQVTATFAYDFPVGDTEVSCTATDSEGAQDTFDFAVTVEDNTPPVIEVPSEPLVVNSLVSPVVVDYTDQVNVIEFGYPGTQAVCEPPGDVADVDPPVPPYTSEFTWGDTTVTCNATDGSGNAADTATFIVSVQYLYEVNLVLPKGRANAGSTIPLDWQYLDRVTGLPIDSSAFIVGIVWEKATDNSCETLTPVPTDGSSFIDDADSGQSDFRYTEGDGTWQVSWQTPDTIGWHKISVFPPGGDVGGAWDCVNLR